MNYGVKAKISLKAGTILDASRVEQILLTRKVNPNMQGVPPRLLVSSIKDVEYFILSRDVPAGQRITEDDLTLADTDVVGIKLTTVERNGDPGKGRLICQLSTSDLDKAQAARLRSLAAGTRLLWGSGQEDFYASGDAYHLTIITPFKTARASWGTNSNLDETSMYRSKALLDFLKNTPQCKCNKKS